MTSDTRLFIGRLSQSVQKRDLEDLFSKYGKVVNCSLKTTYGFVEFEDPHDARDALRELDGYRLEGNMIAVEYSHGRKSERDREGRDDRDRDSRDRDDRGDYGRNRDHKDRDYERDHDRDYDRDSDRNFGRDDRRDYDRRDYDRRDYDRRDYDRRDYDRRDSERDFDRGGFGRRYGRRGRYSPPYNTKYRLTVSGLPQGCSWQDLKDHFRQIGEVCFADVRRDREGKEKGIVEFKHRQDMRDAIRKLEKSRIRGNTISIICEYQGGSTSRSRSVSREKSPVRKSGSKSKSLSHSPNPESRLRLSPRKSRSRSPPKNGDNFGKYHTKSESTSPVTGSPTTGKSDKSEKQSLALEDL